MDDQASHTFDAFDKGSRILVAPVTGGKQRDVVKGQILATHLANALQVVAFDSALLSVTEYDRIKAAAITGSGELAQGKFIQAVAKKKHFDLIISILYLSRNSGKAGAGVLGRCTANECDQR